LKVSNLIFVTLGFAALGLVAIPGLAVGLTLLAAFLNVTILLVSSASLGRGSGSVSLIRRDSSPLIEDF
jgi:hypothetical protein